MFKRLAHLVKTPSPASVIATIALLVAVGGVAVASIPGPDGVITGCYGNSTGTLRVVDSGTTCPGGETLISWNQQGPPGPTGPAGAPGPPGPQGPAGEAPSPGTPPVPAIPPKLTIPPKKPGPKELKKLGIPKEAAGGGSEMFLAVRDARTVARDTAPDLTIASTVVPAGRYYVTADATSELTAGKKVFLGAKAFCTLVVGKDSDSRLLYTAAPQLSLATTGRLDSPGRIELRCSNADAPLPASNPLSAVEDPEKTTQVTLRHIRIAALSVKRYSKKKLPF